MWGVVVMPGAMAWDALEASERLRSAWGESRRREDAIDAFEDVFYREYPQDCVRPLREALAAYDAVLAGAGRRPCECGGADAGRLVGTV